MKNPITQLLCIIIGLSACSPKYYAPNTQNVPLITKKNEATFSAGYGLSGGESFLSFVERFEIQGAYGISDNLAIQGNAGKLWNDSSRKSINAQFIEGGLGYFSKNENNIVFEAYGILGVSSLHSAYLPNYSRYGSSAKGKLSTTLYKYGIQPSIGYKGRILEVAFSTRVMRLHYTNTYGDLVFEGENQIDYIKNNKTHLMLEPSFTFRAGIKNVKFQFQVTAVDNLTNENFPILTNSFSAGIFIRMNR